ncbi:glycosyltransferase family 4 protein [Flavivirga spongiicola]|uniref:Glycosyltransferase family 4 protein n=1 Tax=Flavivirga spongiicola TaxID=421621 RepID=A0ABU7XN63_9FLAO|nr:glycosyltransferase family 4 protein [Flavivirga sp. MEBiC05379]MDO5981660.1 glycosyltransferase family 4 protein [Flavivirga sp. MEBiC05379]
MSFSFTNSNVIIILKSPQLGGAERQALTLAGYLQNSLKCNVFIYTYLKAKASPQFIEFYKKHNLKNIFTVNNPLVAGSKYKYLKIRLKLMLFALKLRKHRPDIIIPYLNSPSLIAAYCKKISGAKVTFWNNRGSEVYRKDKLEKLAVLKTKFFTINSFEAITDIENNFKVSKEKIHFTPNFLTISTKKVVKSKIEESKELIIGMLAHFREEKLQMLLLESFFELSKKHAFIKLHLVGDIFDENKVKKAKEYVKSNKLEHRVRFIHKESAKNTLPEFDIGVLISIKEGMSNSLMEYMYYNLPIVCTNHSGSKYLLGDENDFLINNNKQELIQKLETLILNKDIRDKESDNNKKLIVKGFRVEKYVSDLESIINSL